jgi:hypothetical protein
VCEREKFKRDSAVKKGFKREETKECDLCKRDIIIVLSTKLVSYLELLLLRI